VDQTSAGGLAVRATPRGHEAALVCVGDARRWQLPKGIVERGESPEAAALREVREEAGIEATIVEPLDVVEYWYVGDHGGARVRFHKRVHFYLMRYERGDVADHDREVLEARWFPLDEAEGALAFASERALAAAARARLAAGA
jgi:8-oxo-dGTP pyrophosphatase MutT (NUDIX family)